MPRNIQWQPVQRTCFQLFHKLAVEITIIEDTRAHTTRRRHGRGSERGESYRGALVRSFCCANKGRLFPGREAARIAAETELFITLWPRRPCLLCLCLCILMSFCSLLADVYRLCASGALFCLPDVVRTRLKVWFLQQMDSIMVPAGFAGYWIVCSFPAKVSLLSRRLLASQPLLHVSSGKTRCGRFGRRSVLPVTVECLVQEDLFCDALWRGRKVIPAGGVAGGRISFY